MYANSHFFFIINLLSKLYILWRHKEHVVDTCWHTLYFIFFLFSALYPFICKNSEFCTDHPKIIVKDFDHTLESYPVGVAKVEMQPPHKLFLPLLPTSSRGRLKFGLCQK